MSDRRFFSGGSLAQALNQAAQYFQMTPAEINYKLVEKKHGFLKVRRKVVIEVDGSAPALARSPEAPAGEPAEPPVSASPARSGAPPAAPPESRFETRAEAPPESRPEAPPRPRQEPAVDPPAADDARVHDRPGPMLELDTDEESVASGPEAREPDVEEVELLEAPPPAKARFPEARGEEAEAAADALARILELAGLELESEILQGEEELQVELWGGDQEILLRDRGRLLLAIQHLLPRGIRGLLGRSVPCKVDSDNFHMIREERLRDMAQRAADDVRHRGRPKTLEPMSPDERRIVHLTLADYPGVETESHGSGLFKRVMVRASRGDKPKAFDP